jgi:3-hydroxy acid dehydrogenase/malonic semialdehyde reductase
VPEGARLAGRRALITGAAGGVGRAVAARLLGEGAGLLLTDRDDSDLRALVEALRQAAPSAIGVDCIACDLSGGIGVSTLFEEVDAVLGGLDILVACAGLGSASLMDSSESEWRYVIESNLLSYGACTQRAVERMRASGRRDGIVVLVGSISVHIKAVGESVYNAAKAASPPLRRRSARSLSPMASG